MTKVTAFIVLDEIEVKAELHCGCYQDRRFGRSYSPVDTAATPPQLTPI